MFIRVKIKPCSKEVSVFQKSDDKFEVSVKSKPENNAANNEMISLLSEFLGIGEERLKIVKGGRERSKIIEIL